MVVHFCATIGSTFRFTRLAPLASRPGREDISVLMEWGLDYITILRIYSSFTRNFKIKNVIHQNFW